MASHLIRNIILTGFMGTGKSVVITIARDLIRKREIDNNVMVVGPTGKAAYL